MKAVGVGDREAIAEIVEGAANIVPGVALGIADGDAELVTAYGVTNVDHPLPVTADTLFQVGSITKTFLGTLVMRLVEQGKLDLDAPVRSYVPTLRLRDRGAQERVTLRHCLTHTAGWFGDHFEDFGPSDDALQRYVEFMAEIEQQVPLGTVWAYNNAAFCLAGRAVELVTGMTVERAMRELVFAPLGLERTFFFADEVITHRVASGHHIFDGVPQVARPWAIPRAQNAAGAIISTVGDLLRYARFHLGDGAAADGARVLSPGSMELMRSKLVAGPLGQHRGIAWAIEQVGEVTLIGHNGATIGQQALLSIAPARRFALAMLTNSSRATQLQNAMTRWARKRYLGVEAATPVPREHSLEDAARIVGTYRHPASELEIVVRGGGLVLLQRPFGSLRKRMENPPPLPAPVALRFFRDDRVILTEGPLKDSQIELLDELAAPLEWIRFGGRLFRKV